MFQLQVRVGDLPAAVFSSDQILRRHPDVVKENRIFDSHHEAHMLDGDSRQVCGNMQPTQVLVARPRRVRADQGPQVVGGQVMAHHNLLPVHDVVVAVSNRFGPTIGDVAPALGLRQHLPNRDLPTYDGRQKLLFLFLASPFEHHRSHDSGQGIKDMVQVETVL